MLSIFSTTLKWQNICPFYLVWWKGLPWKFKREQLGVISSLKSVGVLALNSLQSGWEFFFFLFITSIRGGERIGICLLQKIKCRVIAVINIIVSENLSPVVIFPIPGSVFETNRYHTLIPVLKRELNNYKTASQGPAKDGWLVRKAGLYKKSDYTLTIFQQISSVHLGKTTTFTFNKCQTKCNKAGSRGRTTSFKHLVYLTSVSIQVRIWHKPFLPPESSS